jgi:hypothetical protein
LLLLVLLLLLLLLLLLKVLQLLKLLLLHGRTWDPSLVAAGRYGRWEKN